MVLDSYSRQMLYNAIDACDKVARDVAHFGSVEGVLSSYGGDEIVSGHVRQVGEAIYKLRDASRQSYEELRTLVGPTVDLLRVIKLRNILTHHYYDIDWDKLWRAATEWIPIYREAFAAAALQQYPPGR